MTVPYSKIALPLKAMKYLLLQRTEYQNMQKSLAVKLLARLPMESNILSVKKKQAEGFLRKKAIEKLFSHDIYNEYKNLAPHIPAKTSSVLDIGCGLAAIDVFIYQHLQNNTPSINLFDKTVIDNKIHYNYEKTGSYYNSLELAEQILIKNGVVGQHIYCFDTSETEKLSKTKFDLIVSLISWGFHYPVSTYIELIDKISHDQTRLILDIRKNTDGKHILNNVFPHSKLISSDTDKDRIMLCKSPIN